MYLCQQHKSQKVTGVMNCTGCPKRAQSSDKDGSPQIVCCRMHPRNSSRSAGFNPAGDVAWHTLQLAGKSTAGGATEI